MVKKIYMGGGRKAGSVSETLQILYDYYDLKQSKRNGLSEAHICDGEA